MSETTEMTSIVIQGAEGDFSLWRYHPLDELGLKESDLENAIVAHPKALVIDPLELLPGQMVVYAQPVLSFGGSTRRPDVVIVTDHGDVVVVEVKRLVNAELRDGRRAIAQGVEYASLLSMAAEADLVRSLTKGQHSSWDLVCRERLGERGTPGRLANVLRNRISDGDIHIVIACEEAPPDLADLVRAADNSARLAFALHVVEVRPMVAEGASGAAGQPIAWVPRPRLATEIVHRTAVTVRVQGSVGDRAPSIAVDVHDDSASEVKERIANSTGSARRRERQLMLQRVLGPLAESLDVSPEQLWEELGKLHRAVELEDWSLLNDIAQPRDRGPDQRVPNVGEGRYGVNLLSHWKPSVFVGAYLSDHDHRQSLLAPDDGGDFALIVDFRGKAQERTDFANHPCFQALRDRLADDANGWDFADHHAQPRKNSYHPLYLRQPLRDVIGDTQTLDERKARWLASARDAVETLLGGGELAELVRRQQ